MAGCQFVIIMVLFRTQAMLARFIRMINKTSVKYLKTPEKRELVHEI